MVIFDPLPSWHWPLAAPSLGTIKDCELSCPIQPSFVFKYVESVLISSRCTSVGIMTFCYVFIFLQMFFVEFLTYVYLCTILAHTPEEEPDWRKIPSLCPCTFLLCSLCVHRCYIGIYILYI